MSPTPIADLHTHTTASDGLDTPATLLLRAQSASLGAIAITDHDTVDAHLQLARDEIGIPRVIPGIELSANVGTSEVHILGYFINVASADLSSRLSDLRRQRLQRIERFCARLTQLGLTLTMDDVLAEATGKTVGRPHIARAMIARGYVSTVSQAFEQYLAGGRPAFVPRDDVTPESSIELIHKAGGAAVLAHPLTTGDAAGMVDRLQRVGLDGLEVEYGAYSETQRGPLRELARTRHLIPTGGSDFHGVDHRESTSLGLGGVSLETLNRLHAVSERYR